MADNSTSTPLWLDIKTTYIDENFDKVINYLYRESRRIDNHDSFYKTTVDLLSKRTGEVLSEFSSRSVYYFEEHPEEKAQREFETRLLGSFLLVNNPEEAQNYRRAFTTMVSTLSSMVPESFARKLLETAVDFSLGKIVARMPFGWDDIITFTPQIMAHKIIYSSFLSNQTSSNIWYENKGTLNIKDGVMNLAAMNRESYSSTTSLVPSLGVLDGRINVLVKKNEKVKQSDKENIERIDRFTQGFVLDQKAVSLSKKVKQTYVDGDVFDVRVCGREGGHIFVESIDRAYEMFSGKLLFDQNILYYDESDFIKHLPDNEIIRVQKTGNSTCSIFDEFVKYIVEERAVFGEIILAKYITETTDRKGIQKIVWWTVDGYPAYSFKKDGFDKGCFAEVKIQNHGKDKYYGYINCEISGATDDYFDYDYSKKSSIEGFSYGTYDPDADLEDTLSPGTVKEIYRMIVSCQKSLPQPSERYKMLCVSRILSELICDSEDSAYVDFMADYLENLVLFAKSQYDEIKTLKPDIRIADLNSVRLRMDIVAILKAYGDDSKADELSHFIHDGKDPLLVKIATLVQSCNRIDDVISKSMKNVLKREITKCLSMETAGETDLEEENGLYLGLESNRQEFKTSFFHAPANAKEQSQKLNIFKVICAFLNTQVGGTLYLGVDDLGYVKGLDEDLKYLYKSVPGSYRGLDGYIRHITDEAKKYFELGVLSNVSIEPAYDNQVVIINVSPYEYGVVELEGVPYIRLNNESVKMNDVLKQQIMDKRIFTNQKKTATISAIQNAIQDKRKVILHDYRSSESGTISDRSIEPYAFNSGYSYFWCYDEDRQRNIILRTDRVSNVEVRQEHWENERLHKQGKMDAFHMTGQDPIHIILQLSLKAMNLLSEEYPEAKSSIIQTEDDNKWIFDTEVYSLKGVGRFYIGLASEITIIDAPGLAEYARDYVGKNIK